MSVVTFAIPCCDAGPYLEPLLESILAQSRQDFTLILVDDASTDGSVDVARSIAGDRIKIVENEARLGLAANWNRCAELVETPMFCLAHMDDVYASTYLERMVERLERVSTAAFAHCRAEAIDAEGRRVASPAERFKDRFWHDLESADRADWFRRLMRGNFINCPSVLYRTAAWHSIGGVDAKMRFAPDWKLWFASLLANFDIVSVPETLVGYRRHAASATNEQARSMRRYEEELEVLAWAGAAGAQADLLSAREANDRTALRNTMLYDAYSDLRAGRPTDARAKLAFLRAVPGLARDRMVRTFGVLSHCGALGRTVLGLGMRACTR